MEVYIDDIAVKSKTRGEHAQYLEKTFRPMRKYNMKLNPTKCAFSVSTEKFLGFMVTQRGIEVNPDQIRVVVETLALSSKKELQHLTGHLVALGCFISRFTNKLRYFFLMLKRSSTIDWMDECGQTFKKVKGYLTKPPILSSLQSNKQLYMYLVVSDCQCCSVLAHRRQRAKTHLLREQSNGRCRNPILHNGADSLSPEKRCPETPSIFSGLPSDYTHKSTTQEQPTQVESIQTNFEKGH